MSSALLSLLTENLPKVETRRALLVLDLQQDLVSPDGKLPARTDTGFVDRIKDIVAEFRQSGQVFWVRTILDPARIADSKFGLDEPIVTQSAAQDMNTSSDLEHEANDDEEDDDSHDDNDDNDDNEDDYDDNDEEEEAGDQLLEADLASYRERVNHTSGRLTGLLNRASKLKAQEERTASRSSSVSAKEIDEQFLLSTSKREPCCLAGTPGSEFAPEIQPVIDASRDAFLVKSRYSAFNSTSLLMTLRIRLVTDLYLCGCFTNTSVYATAMDAASHGLNINVISDCLGYRSAPTHEDALGKMIDLIGANMISSSELRSTQEVGQSSNNEGVDGAAYSPEERDLSASMRKAGLGERPDSKSNVSSAGNQDPSGKGTPSGLEVDSDETEGSDLDAQGQFLAQLRSGGRRRQGESAEQRVIQRLQQTLVDSHRMVRPTVIRTRPRTAQGQPGEGGTNMPSKTPNPTAPDAERTLTGTAGVLQDQHNSDMRKDLHDGDTTTAKLQSKESAGQVATEISGDKASKSIPKLLSSDIGSSKPPSTSANNTGASASHASQNKAKGRTQSLANLPTLGPEDVIGEGDSHIVYNLFAPTRKDPRDQSKLLRDTIFDWLYDDVRWQKMFHAQGEVPRLVAVQGEIGEDGSMPVYRHPSDQAPTLLHFSPPVQLIREEVQRVVKHPVNHVLIQLYRSGQDYISEHSDKTLDIVRDSSIVNVSFGAQRTMRLRTKKSAKLNADAEELAATRQVQRIAMPHNSMFILGQDSNMRWLHGINADKRPQNELSEAQKAYSGCRISLTFRSIGTFLDAKAEHIWGQGATSKRRETMQKVINNDPSRTEELIDAFGKENRSTDFDWDEAYGGGFDVLHFREAPPSLPTLFPSGDYKEDLSVRICLEELGVPYSLSDPPPDGLGRRVNRKVCYRDTDIRHTEVQGAAAILLYLDRYHHPDSNDEDRSITAAAYTFVLDWETVRKAQPLAATTDTSPAENYGPLLKPAERDMEGRSFRAGHRFSIADCAFWPFLHEAVQVWEDWPAEEYPNLAAYLKRIGDRESVKKVVSGEAKSQSKEEVQMEDKKEAKESKA